MPAPVSNQAANSLQYQQFVNFAKNARWRQTTLESYQAAGGGLAIRASTRGDFIGHIRRDAVTQNENDTIRNAFKQTVLDLFGVTQVAQLPEAVQKEMKLDDYGKGKPLSVRRIRAVNAVVEKQIATLSKPLMATCNWIMQLEELNNLRRHQLSMDDTVKARLYTALKACEGDEEVFELLKTNVFGIVYDKEFCLNSDDEVRENVQRIRDNLRALRREFARDPNAYNALKPFMGESPNIVYTSNLLRGMTGVVYNDPKDWNQFMLDSGLQFLTSSSPSPKDVRVAAEKFSAYLEKAADDGLGKANSRSRRQFLAVMILARAGFTGSAARELQHKLETGAGAKKLVKYYRSKVKEPELPEHVILPSLPGSVLSEYGGNEELKNLKESVDACCEGPYAPDRFIKPYWGKVTARDVGLEDPTEDF